MIKPFRAKHNKDYIKNGLESDSAKLARKKREKAGERDEQKRIARKV